MANEFWINRTAQSTGWVKANEVWVNIDGTSTGWKEADEVWMNIDGTSTGWKLVHEKAAADPAFTASSFLSDSDGDEDGTSDNANCDCESAGPKYNNGWCIRYTLSDCVNANHDVYVQKDTGGGFFNDSTVLNCTKPNIGWCGQSTYGGAINDGTYGTEDCPTVGDKFRVVVEPQGGGADYDYAPNTTGWTLSTCVAV